MPTAWDMSPSTVRPSQGEGLQQREQRDRSGGGELERTLGLRQAMTIGTGTMVGAGIFVFPGIAAGRAGPGAVLSFLLGAVVALLVALPTAELATAMPRSGGGYYFVSRGLGSLPGAIVGIGQWVGLVFASAFYLVGFAHYLSDALTRVGLGGVSVGAVGAVAGATLTAIAVLGAEKTGNLQDALVGLLLVVFGGILGYGMLTSTGVVGQSGLPSQWLPFGALPVLTTAGLVFTSYLGFAQIATVAGDVRDPGRTLPRAMIGSVLLVAALYAGMLLVSTSVFSSEQLAEFGETAAVEVAASLLGPVGAFVLVGCGVLATLSSANASILSASRGVYALSRDGLVPDRAATVNRRYGTPHVSLALAGVPVLLLVLTGRTELLAEVASVLHLVMYGLMCVALLVLRRRDPAWYRPSFTSPGGPLVPAVGAVASFGLIAFVQPLAIGLGVVVVLLAAGWWMLMARDVELRRGEGDGRAALPLPGVDRILVPAMLPDPDPLPAALLDLLEPLDTSVVGVHRVPKQTAVEQARDQFEEESREALEQWAEPLSTGHEGGRPRLVFAQDPLETIARIAAEEEVAAVLVPRPVDRDEIGRVVIALRGDDHAERTAGLVEGLVSTAGASIRIVHVVGAEREGGEQTGGEFTRLRDELEERGISEERVSFDIREGTSVTEELADLATDHDMLVLGETDRGAPDQIFSDVHRHLAEEVERPVLVVRWTAAERADG